MANNKNQHFVPRAHFKPFSVQGEGDAIHLFNIDRMLEIYDAPLKNQCSGNYFYGRDSKLENAIQTVEGGYAACVLSLQRPDAVLTDSHFLVLRRFSYLQHIRTEAAARVLAQSSLAITSVKGSDLEQPTLKEAIKGAVISAMLHYADSIQIVDDLKVVVVRNRTAIPFVTSDDPAVLANRWHNKDPRAKHKSFGIGSAGSLLFLPLSPSLLAILFDGDIYNVGHVTGWVDVINPQDIAACNDQQILNCAQNIYFRDKEIGIYIKSRLEAIRHLRPFNKFDVFMAVPDVGSDTHTRYVVVKEPNLKEHGEVLTHVRSTRPIPASWPSFLKFKTRRFVFTNDTGAGFRRRTTAVSSSWDSPPWRKVKG